MDVIERNLKICRVRLGERFPNVRYAVNNGFNYEPLGSGQASAIYCYDAMVHFSGDLVESYLADTARVLRPGGRALFHHSNYDGPQLEHFGQHPHARQRMTQQRFLALAEQAKLRIVESQIIPWAGIPDLDCVTMVEKPEDRFCKRNYIKLINILYSFRGRNGRRKRPVFYGTKHEYTIQDRIYVLRLFMRLSGVTNGN